MSLTPIVSPARKRRIISFDLEWIPAERLKPPKVWDGPIYSDELKLRVCGVYDPKGYRFYHSIRDFLDNELNRENRGAWFYAHAGGLADMEFVFDEIIRFVEEDGASAYKVRACFSGSAAIITKIKRGKNVWTFVDSYWLLRDKLANIGKGLDMKKLHEEERKTPEEIRRYFAEAPLEKLIPYNEQDCRILWEAVDRFQSTVMNMGGQLQMTIAATGLSLFRRKFLKKEVETKESVNEIADQAYFASRVEVFNETGEDFKIYDINSSFPHAMTFPCPGACIGRRRTIPDRQGAIYLAEVDIEVPDMYLPPIPYRLGGRLFFPTGRWKTWLTGIDVEMLIKYGGTVHEVFDVIEFEENTDLRDYAKTIYNMRVKTSHKYEKLVYKYLLNSLYGKFAEGMVKTSLLIHPDKIDRETMEMLMPGVWQMEKIAKVTHRHVPMSAWITAIARRTLYDDVLAPPLQMGEKIHYCDTDSGATPANLSTSTVLGGLKLEKKMDWAKFVGPKIYIGEGTELAKDGKWKPIFLNKAKGFTLPDTKEAATKRLTEIIEGKEIYIQRMARIREILRIKDSTPVEVLIKKALTGRNIKKRHHNKDGSTRPWTIKELWSMVKKS